MKIGIVFSAWHLKLMPFLVLCVLGTSSCKKVLDKSLEEIQSEYSLIGDYHQMGLNFILEDLKEECAKNEITPSLSQLTKTVNISSAQFTVETLNLNQQTESAILKIQESIKLGSIKSYPDESIIDLVEEQVPLTTKQAYYLSKLDLILSGLYNDIYQYVGAIKNLEAQIYNNCSMDEISLLFTATAVGANSLVYWYNNYDIWEDKLELNDLKGTMHKEWFWAALNRMGKADIAGGVVGGCLGALAGGVGAVPGALAGACTASGNCGLVCLYEHLTE